MSPSDLRLILVGVQPPPPPDSVVLPSPRHVPDKHAAHVADGAKAVVMRAIHERVEREATLRKLRTLMPRPRNAAVFGSAEALSRRRAQLGALPCWAPTAPRRSACATQCTAVAVSITVYRMGRRRDLDYSLRPGHRHHVIFLLSVRRFVFWRCLATRKTKR